MTTFDIYWAPEGRRIATVEANGIARAKRMAPQPYRKYLGELYVLEVQYTHCNGKQTQCTVSSDCARHAGGCTK
jgi:hypothetical protein